MYFIMWNVLPQAQSLVSAELMSLKIKSLVLQLYENARQVKSFNQLRTTITATVHNEYFCFRLKKL